MTNEPPLRLGRRWRETVVNGCLLVAMLLVASLSGCAVSPPDQQHIRDAWQRETPRAPRSAGGRTLASPPAAAWRAKEDF